MQPIFQVAARSSGVSVVQAIAYVASSRNPCASKGYMWSQIDAKFRIFQPPPIKIRGGVSQGFKLKFVLGPNLGYSFHTHAGWYYILCLCAIILLQLSVFRALTYLLYYVCYWI